MTDPNAVSHADTERGRTVESLKGLIWKEHPCLLWPVLRRSVLHTTASPPAQANTEMLSVHLLGFIVTEEISRVDKMWLNLIFKSCQQISFEVWLSQFPLYRMGGDMIFSLSRYHVTHLLEASLVPKAPRVTLHINRHFEPSYSQIHLLFQSKFQKS